MAKAQEDVSYAQTVVAHAVEAIVSATEGDGDALKLTIETLLAEAHQKLDVTSNALKQKRHAIGDSELARTKLRDEFVPILSMLAACRRQVEQAAEDAVPPVVSLGAEV